MRGLQEVKQNTGRYPKRSVNDAGYWDPEQVAGAPPGVEVFMATAKTHKIRKAMASLPPPRGRIPKGMTLRERMERKLRTKRGWGWYRLRGRTVELAFGDTRENRGFKSSLLRGREKADAEWQLVQMGLDYQDGLHSPAITGAKRVGWTTTCRPAGFDPKLDPSMFIRVAAAGYCASKKTSRAATPGPPGRISIRAPRQNG